MTSSIVQPSAVTPDPYAEGGRAWFNEQTVRACPYPIPGDRARLWLAGWQAAEDEFWEASGTVVDVELGGEGG